MMMTSDLALRMDPGYAPIARRYLENPDELSAAFARAWFKLTHRDMGPKTRYLGPEAPKDDLLWQHPIPAETLGALESIRKTFNDEQSDNKQISIADLIVLGGCAGVEKAAKDAGVSVDVAFAPGRTDATQEQTDIENISYLEPAADGFRNYVQTEFDVPAEYMLVDRAQLLTLSAPEMTALLGGFRSLNINYDGSDLGVLTDRPGTLSRDFFVNLLDMATEWTPTDDAKTTFEGRDRLSGDLRWRASRVDLVFGSDSQLRAICEVYAAEGAEGKFVCDFVSAWTKFDEPRSVRPRTAVGLAHHARRTLGAWRIAPRRDPRGGTPSRNPRTGVASPQKMYRVHTLLTLEHCRIHPPPVLSA